MIIALFILLAGVLLQILQWVLSGINFLVPNAVASAVSSLVSYVWYFNGIFPIETLLLCVTTLLTFWGFWYFFRVTLWLLGFITRHDHQLPTMISTDGKYYEGRTGTKRGDMSFIKGRRK